MKKRRRRRRKPAPKRALLRRLILPAGALLLAGLLASLWYADRLTTIFEAREQEVSSRLLGRPYRLAEGALGSAEDLVRRLDRLGYTRVRGSADDPGTYTAWRNVVQAHLRPDGGEGGERSSSVVRVRFRSGRIASVDRQDAFLEPETLSLFYGPEMEERELVEVKDCPADLINAILAAEDRRFFSHPGVDPFGILRAFWTNLSSGHVTQGGSTLTQQLAKNLYFTRERSFVRKGKEAFAAVVLEASYSKERLLRAYINEVYLGQRGPASVRGVGRAARHYFDKKVGDLTLAESALLAGMIRAPGRYNPFLHAEAAMARRDTVLKGMVEIGAITAEQQREAAAQPIHVSRPASEGRGIRAPYVAEMIRQELIDQHGSLFWQRGLSVHTSIDPAYQESAEAAVAAGLEELSKSYSAAREAKDGSRLQAALVTLDLHSGGLLAMVGGRDFARSQFNRVTSARRQPGSLFKPVVYLAGLTHPGDEDDEDQDRLFQWRDTWSGDDDVVRLPGARNQGATVPAVNRRLDEPGEEIVPVRKKKKRRWWSWGDPEDDVPVQAGPALPFNAATVLLDEPYEVESGGRTWSPGNWDRRFRGPVTVQRALEESLNVPTARAAAAIGLDRVVATAHALGIRSKLPEVPSIALGTAEVTPLEMATAFATIASNGAKQAPFLIRRIEDGTGRSQSLRAGWPYPPANQPLIAGATGGHGRREPGSAWSDRDAWQEASRDANTEPVPRRAAQLMTALLQGVMIHGTGRSAARLGFDGIAAGKTGTSDGGRDLWFCGYTPDILTLVWVGFDDGTPIHLSGARGALPIWVDYMKRIGAETGKPFEGDSHLLWAPIDPTTGHLARRACPESRWAPFIPGTEPVVRCTDHRGFWDRWRN
jgi:membrane peptidoglycan carboxypeptidase